MKKLLVLLLGILLISSPASAKRESSSEDATSVLLYGKYNDTLVPVKVESDGSMGGAGGTWYAKDTTSNLLTIYNYARDTILFQIDKNGVPSYQPTAASPAVVAGTSAGTGPILTIDGSDTGGIITLTTGTSCATSNTILTATFRSFAPVHAPGVILYPMNANAAALTGASQVYTTSTTTTFLLKAGSTALADSTQYIWTYKLSVY